VRRARITENFDKPEIFERRDVFEKLALLETLAIDPLAESEMTLFASLYWRVFRALDVLEITFANTIFTNKHDLLLDIFIIRYLSLDILRDLFK